VISAALLVITLLSLGGSLAMGSVGARFAEGRGLTREVGFSWGSILGPIGLAVVWMMARHRSHRRAALPVDHQRAAVWRGGDLPP
jgi:hypothetical protein